MPPSFYNLPPDPPPVADSESTIEPPPAGIQLVQVPSDDPPPLMSYYVIPAPGDLSLDDDLGELTPLIQTRVILTRTCFRYVNRWHCTAPK